MAVDGEARNVPTQVGLRVEHVQLDQPCELIKVDLGTCWEVHVEQLQMASKLKSIVPTPEGSWQSAGARETQDDCSCNCPGGLNCSSSLSYDGFNVYSFISLPWEALNQCASSLSIKLLASSLGNKQVRVKNLDSALVKCDTVGDQERVCKLNMQSHSPFSPLFDVDIVLEQVWVLIANHSELEV